MLIGLKASPHTELSARRLLGDRETEFNTKIKMTAGWKEMMVLFVALSCDPLRGVSVLGFSSLSLSGPSGPAARGWNDNWTHKQICFSVGNTHMMTASTFVLTPAFSKKNIKQMMGSTDWRLKPRCSGAALVSSAEIRFHLLRYNNIRILHQNV